MGILVGDAEDLARSLLDTPELAGRWLHVQGVARRAAEYASAVDKSDRELLVAAAWLHDIGYARPLIRTGMHAIDGAQYLQGLGFDARLVALVAHHTGARYEAEERGLTALLDALPRIDGLLEDALTTADLLTSPMGDPTDEVQRVGEILTRYPVTSPVHRAVSRAQHDLIAQVHRVRTLHAIAKAVRPLDSWGIVAEHGDGGRRPV